MAYQQKIFDLENGQSVIVRMPPFVEVYKMGMDYVSDLVHKRLLNDPAWPKALEDLRSVRNAQPSTTDIFALGVNEQTVLLVRLSGNSPITKIEQWTAEGDVQIILRRGKNLIRPCAKEEEL